MKDMMKSRRVHLKYYLKIIIANKPFLIFLSSLSFNFPPNITFDTISTQGPLAIAPLSSTPSNMLLAGFCPVNPTTQRSKTADKSQKERE